MKKLTFILAATLICTSLVRAEAPAQKSVPDHTLSGPLTHKNLQIFLISGEDRLTEIEIKTLDEAMKDKSTVVNETSDVNKLSIENHGKKGYVFVQAGDIVKGGRQDRTLPTDFLVKAGSGKLPVDAFCVEHGRWNQRGKESTAAFSGSGKSLSSKELKYAAKVEKNQSSVWDNVSKTQGKLSANVYKPDSKVALSTSNRTASGGGTENNVNDARSATSLQLSLENPKLQIVAQEYLDALKNSPKENAQSVGFAYAVNGEMSSAEIYANHALFLKFWDKLLESAIHEAIAEQKEGAEGAPVALTHADAWLDEAAAAETKREEYPSGNVTLRKENGKSVSFDTLVPAAKGSKDDSTWVHRSVLSKTGIVPSSPSQPSQLQNR